MKSFTQYLHKIPSAFRVFAIITLVFAYASFTHSAFAQSQITVYCQPNYSSATIGTSVTFVAHPAGATQMYSYSWTGTDGLYGTSGAVYPLYTTPGTKTATVTVTAGSQSATASCSIDMEPAQNSGYSDSGYSSNPTTGNLGLWGSAYNSSGYVAYTQSNAYTNNTSNDGNVSVYVESGPTDYSVTSNSNSSNYYSNSGTANSGGVYLSQVPYTGPTDNWKIELYATAFLLWSFVISYMILKKKYGKKSLALSRAKSNDDTDDDEFAARIASLRDFI